MDSPSIPAPRNLQSIGLMVATGLVNTMSVAWIACPKPEEAGTTLPRIWLVGAAYVLFTALAGAVLNWAFWRIFRPELLLGFREVVLAGAPAWLFVPPMVYLLRGDSAWAIPLAILTGAAAALCTRALVPVPPSPSLAEQYQSATPFAMLPPSRTHIGQAIGIAAAIEIGALLSARGDLVSPGFILGLAACSITWLHLTLRAQADSPQSRHPLRRMTVALVVSVLITVAALLPKPPRGFPGGGLAAMGTGKNPPTASGEKSKETGLGSGFRGIILWPVEEKKKQLVVIAPRHPLQLNPLDRKPVTIPFDGPYWYFKPPAKSPGRTAHVTHGDPAKVYIRSNDWLPLLMEAHQTLGNSVDLACCRELDIDIRNGDNHPGEIHLGLVLSDGTSPGKLSLPLAPQTVISTEEAHFYQKAAGVNEMLRFPIPSRARIHKFNEITVVFFPSEDRSQEGARIAIEDFVLIPR